MKTPRKASIGDYKIVGRPLGRGATSTVYRVQDSQGQEFAVKELAPQFLSDREAVRRFKQEFEIAGRLKHPGIVRTHELLEANGTLNIRMDLVDGASLKELLRKARRLDSDLACWIALQASRILAHAHDNDVIHRDVKPDNLMFSSAGTLLLGDFGTARLLDLSMTRTGMVMGTPIYMAPELLKAKKKITPSPCIDVYSLGAVLYQAIEGRSPFSAFRKAELLSLIYEKTFQDPKPIKRIEDPKLADLIARCLSREPVARPQTMAELARELKSHCPTRTADIDPTARIRSILNQRRTPRASKPKTVAAVVPAKAMPVKTPPPPGLRPQTPFEETWIPLFFFATIGVLILYLVTVPPSSSSTTPDPGAASSSLTR